MLRANPAQLSIDVGAATTLLTGVGVLGFGHQFHNPTAITLIEGVEEHSLAAILTLFQINFGYRFAFNAWAKKEIADWKKNTYLVT